MRTSRIVGFLLAVPVFVLAAAGDPQAPPATPRPPSPAWLGVFLGDAADGGVELVEVARGGPADRAGLKPGDVLIQLDGTPITGRGALEAVVERLAPGKRVKAEILRGGRSETLWLEPAARRAPAWVLKVESSPEDVTTLFAGPRGPLEMTVVEIPDELRAHYGAPAGSGALVARVVPGGSAAEAGVSVGDIVVRIDAETVTGPQDIVFAEGARAVEIEVVRRREHKILKMEATPAPQAAEALAPRPTPPAPARARDVERMKEEIRRLKEKLAQLEAELLRLRADE